MSMRMIFGLLIVSLGASPVLEAAVSNQKQAAEEPIYANVPGTIALENDRVIVRRLIIQPGQSTGQHTRTGHELLVFVKGGVLKSNAGRSTLWPDGRVVWLEDAGQDDGATNTGSTAIELVSVRIRPPRSSVSHLIGSNRGLAAEHLNYPNIPGEDVLENDQMIVQRFKMNPGEWEGIHAHNANTFYIFIRGGEWLSKSKAHPEGVPGSASDGLVAWMDTIDITEEHQSGNTGTTSAEVVWVALKDQLR